MNRYSIVDVSILWAINAAWNDGDKCPRCEHVECICIEDEDANPMFPDDVDPYVDEDDMRDECDEAAGI